MTIQTEQTAGFMDYDQMIAMKRMDPVRAEQFKEGKRTEYQVNRIKRTIDDLKNEYADNVERDPENKGVYADRLRAGLTQIAGINEYPEFKELVVTAQKQLDGLEETKDELNNINPEIPSSYDQEGMDELSADEPEVDSVPEASEAEVEAKESEEIDNRIDDEEPAAEVPAVVAPEPEVAPVPEVKKETPKKAPAKKGGFKKAMGKKK